MATPQAGRGTAAPGERCRMTGEGPSESHQAEERPPLKPSTALQMNQTAGSGEMTSHSAWCHRAGQEALHRRNSRSQHGLFAQYAEHVSREPTPLVKIMLVNGHRPEAVDAANCWALQSIRRL